MTGQEQCDRLVAKLAVGHAFPSSSRGQEAREKVARVFTA